MEGHLLEETEKQRQNLLGGRACQLPRAHADSRELGLDTSPRGAGVSVLSVCMSPEPPCPGDHHLEETARGGWLLSEPLLRFSGPVHPWSAGRRDSCMIWKS